MKRISFAILAALVLSYGLAFGNAITVNNVIGSFGGGAEDTVMTSAPIKFMLRYQNTQGVALSIFNGYEIYSPDGAVWSGPLQGDSTSGPGAPLTKGSGNFDLAFSIGVFDGATKDTFGIGGQRVSGPGLPIGYNNVPYGLAIGSFANGDDGKTICIDSAWYRPAGTWKWTGSGGLTVLPTWGGPYCYTIYFVPNLPPTVTNVPVDITGNYCTTLTHDFNGADNEGDPFTFELVTGPGSINAATGVWSWNGATIGDVGASISIEVRACQAGPVCGPSVIVPIIVTNAAPTITGCPTAPYTISEGGIVTTDLGVNDECTVPADVWSVVFSSGNGPDDAIGVDANGVVTFTAGSIAAPRTVCAVVTVNDGQLTDECTICYDVFEGGAFGVQISKEHGVTQGTYWNVPVILTAAAKDMGGFSFLISYDQSAMVLSSVTIGPSIGPDGCGWEYFTYRFGAFGNCSGGCPSGLVQVTALAETNNGPNHPDCFSPGPGSVLFYLTFLVSNDRTLECQYAPIRFFWMDCTDNTISSEDGSILYISRTVADFYTDPIAGPSYIHNVDPATNVETFSAQFPTPFGAQEECVVYQIRDTCNDVTVYEGNSLPQWWPSTNLCLILKPTVVREIDFINGGLDIVCADSIDSRGDVNLNGLSNEIADAVMFTRYFIVGLSAFNAAGNVQGSIAATEINGDGIPLSVADLVYLIRVIVGDALPLPKVAPVVVNLSNNAGILSVDAEIAAASIVVKGEARPTLLADNMAMESFFDGTNTRILVYPPFEGVTSIETFSGAFISLEGTIVSVEMATPEAGVAKVEGGLAPSAYKLADNYPNPFNPSTTVGFSLPVASDYTLTIYNVTGQRVFEVSGSKTAGNHTEVIDLNGQASGIYFYKLTAGSFSETKKMVFLK